MWDDILLAYFYDTTLNFVGRN